MNNKNDLRMMLRDALDNLWSRVLSLVSGLDGRVEDIEEAGYISQETDPTVPAWAKQPNPPTETDPTVPAWAKAATKPTYTAAEVGAIAATEKGSAGGVAELDANGLVLSSQLPSYVDDVLEYASASAFPATGESGKIYVDTSTNLTYRWTGTGYTEISPTIALGETSSTAYRGDRGKIAYDHAQARGSAYAQGLYRIATNDEGHVTAATPVEKSDITALGIPEQDTTYSPATESADGLMSAGDKARLNHAFEAETVGPAGVVSLADGIKDMPVKDLTVAIEPVQAGSGDPSPENIRPISGWSGVNVYVSPTQDAQDATIYAVTFPADPGTVYGGTLDVVNGELTVDTAGVDMGSLNWKINGKPGPTTTEYIASNLNKAYGRTNMLCSIFEVARQAKLNAIRGRDASESVSAVVENSVQDFKAFVSGQMLVYELSAPITYQLTQQEVTTLLGTNYIWADAGDVTVTYGDYIASLLEQIAAQGAT